MADVSRESGAARIKNVFRAVKRLDSVCGVGLDRSILVDVYPDIVERYRLRVGTEDTWYIRRSFDLQNVIPIDASRWRLAVVYAACPCGDVGREPIFNKISLNTVGFWYFSD
ncbi:MAG: hypothetical protein OXC68_01175, partial [Aestuariivita sp.]|nr:hypothetical protein [Aestuariivita sp.]